MSTSGKSFRTRVASLLPSMGVRVLEDKFFNAVYTRNVPEINRFLEKGVNVNKRYKFYGVCVLHLLAERNDITLGYRLIHTAENVDLNARTYQGYTALHFSAFLNCKTFCTLLLESGADPHVPDRLGNTALHLAVQKNNYGIVLRLLKHGVETNLLNVFDDTPLSICLLETRNILIARTLFSFGTNMSREAERNLHVFFEAILNCHTLKDIECVLLILEQGIDIAMSDSRTGRTCLHFVAITGYIELAVVLVDKGAIIKGVFDNAGRSPYKVAVEHENDMMADYFLKGYRPPRLFRALPLIKLWVKKLKARISENELIRRNELEKKHASIHTHPHHHLKK